MSRTLSTSNGWSSFTVDIMAILIYLAVSFCICCFTGKLFAAGSGMGDFGRVYRDYLSGRYYRGTLSKY